MNDMEQLVRLLERWRDANSFERVRVGVDAAQLVRSLEPTAKRALAVEVAARVAPQLVPQIESEVGDLSGQQVQALVDLLRRADREDLDDLVRALRSGDVDPALALVDDALDALAPPSGEADDGAPPPDHDPPSGPPPTGAPVDDVPPPDDEIDGPSVTAAAGTAAGAAAGAVAAAELVDDEELLERAERVEGALEDEAALVAAAKQAAASSSDRFRSTSPTLPSLDVSTFDLDLDLSFAMEDELPDPRVVEVAPLGSIATGGGPARDGADHPAGRPATGPISAAVAAVAAQPVGFRRRRAALAAIRRDRVEPADVPGLVAEQGSPSDRAWVAGAAIDAGLLDLSGLDRIELTDPVRRRLARRLA